MYSQVFVWVVLAFAAAPQMYAFWALMMPVSSCPCGDAATSHKGVR